MVSTRRTAQQEPLVQMDLDATIRKKPVRRAMVKQAEPETESRAPRAKNVDASPKEASEASKEPANERKTTAASRSKIVVKKAAEKAAKPVAPAATKPTTNPTKATRTTKKVGISVDTSTDLSAPAGKPPARRTRAAATNSQPLSPKKITQVSRPATRNAKPVGDKGVAKKAPAVKNVVSTRKTRRRAPSDENADVHTASADTPEEEGEEIQVTILPSKRVRASQGERDQDSEIMMSSRPTTPSDSGMPVPEENENDADEKACDSSEEDDWASEEDSADELCGPKTPMKRSSPDAHAKYIASVQGAVQRYNSEVPDKTPIRRFEKDGNTPVTAKAHANAIVHNSAARPMTVARGGDRAFVFRELRKLPRAEEQEEETSDHEDITMFDGVDKPQPEVSSPSHQDIVRLGSSEDVEDSILGQVPQQLADESLLLDEGVGTGPIDSDIDSDGDSTDSSDDTVIIREHADGIEPKQDDCEDMAMTDEDEDDDDDAPETLVWENIRPDVTIQVDFDAHFNGSRMLPQIEPTELLDVAGESPVDVTDPTTSEPQAQSVQEVVEMPCETRSNSSSCLDIFASRRGTLNMADFIHSNALGEPSPMKPTPRSTRSAVQVDSAPREIGEWTAASEDASLEQPETGKDLVEEVDEYSSQDGQDEELMQAGGDALADAGVETNLNPLYEEQTPVRGAIAEDVQSCDMTQGADEDEVVDSKADDSLQSTSFGAEMLAITVYQMNLEASDESTAGLPEVVAEHQRACTEETAFGNQQGLVESSEEIDLPHYAQSTVAFDARRKSMPAFSFQTPTKCRSRPHTSDGASMPRLKMPLQRLEIQALCTTPVRAPRISPEQAEVTIIAPEEHLTQNATPKERYPRLNPRTSYAALATTAMPATRFFTPVKSSLKRPASARKANAEFATPRASTLRPRAAKEPVAIFESDLKSPVAKRVAVDVEGSPEHATLVDLSTPRAASPVVATPVERFPRLPARKDYEQLANTVAGPQRFCTPLRSAVKRPATARKPGTLKRVALKNSTPKQTPLKATAFTPGQIPMTPHPAAPLRGVVAIVEVYTSEGASASSTFVAVLHSLGAKTTTKWSDRITHVVFKEGSPTTLQRIRNHNNDVAEGGAGTQIHCVNSRWVNDCEAEGKHVDESTYLCDLSEVPRGGQRRRKSMEPGVFHNIGGNVVRDRTSSWGKNSLRRSTIEFDSPAERSPQDDHQTTPKAIITQLSDDEGSPATPDWLHPEKLVQQTAPLKRVRKLDLEAKENRRLTGWDAVKF